MINKEQYEFLKRISTNSLEKADLTEKEIRFCLYFVECNFIESYSRPIVRTPTKCESKRFPSFPLKLTPYGENVVSSYELEQKKTWIPITLSIIAIVISIAALAVSVLRWILPMPLN